MKKLLFILCILCSISCFSQDGKSHNPQTGVKGFIESGYTIGVGKGHEGRIPLLATIGWQFNPYLFIGVGSGENYFHDSKQYGIPVYGDIRANLPISWVSPYIDVKIGASMADVKGFYIRPSAGCRFGATNNTALILGIGYEHQHINESDLNLGGISINIGFEF